MQAISVTGRQPRKMSRFGMRRVRFGTIVAATGLVEVISSSAENHR